MSNTFLKVPHIVVLSYFGISEEFLDLGVPIRYDAVQLNSRLCDDCKAPLQTFLFHVHATTNLVALLRNMYMS